MDDQKNMTLKTFQDKCIRALNTIYPHTEISTFFFLLIEEFLNLKRIDYTLNPNLIIKKDVAHQLNKALERLTKEEPIQYIIGNTEFYGYPFIVNKHTLIPRPETEELVTWVIEEIKKNPKKNQLSILDIGTGSGCIIIALAKELIKHQFYAIDISNEAIKIAKTNAKENDVVISFLQLDILKTEKLPTSFDIIISNPPYVRALEKIEIKNNVLQFEPHRALFVSDENPLVFYDKIAALAKTHLHKNGLLFFEINQYLGKETLNLIDEMGFKNTVLRKDLFGNYRMIKAEK